MKLEFFISFPVRFDADCFRDSSPTLYEVLGHYICLQNEATELRLGLWSKEDIYNSVADDLIQFYSTQSLDTIKKISIVKLK